MKVGLVCRDPRGAPDGGLGAAGGGGCEGGGMDSKLTAIASRLRSPPDRPRSRLPPTSTPPTCTWAHEWCVTACSILLRLCLDSTTQRPLSTRGAGRLAQARLRSAAHTLQHVAACCTHVAHTLLHVTHMLHTHCTHVALCCTHVAGRLACAGPGAPYACVQMHQQD